jgi:hypothetical protein
LGKFQDLTGQTFNRLTVLKRIYKENDKRTYWECRCLCGNIKIIRQDWLKNGLIKSCGCLHIEQLKQLHKNNKKYNKYNLSGEYGIGYTSKKEEFYFDLDDYNKIKDYWWYIDSNGYVVTKILNQKPLQMHRLILNASSNEFIDHKKHNKNDNRKNELRKVTKSQNSMNLKTPVNNTSGYKGVSWSKVANKWHASIQKNKISYHLGYFDDINDAVNIRKATEEKLFGEYSYDNSMNNAGIDQ